MEEKEIYIIEKARELFMKYGIKSVSMDDISHQLGISKKTLYQYFKDKADLVYKVVTTFSCEHDKRMSSILESEMNAIELLLLVSKHTLEMLRSLHPPLLFDLRKYYPELTKELIISKKSDVFNKVKSNLLKGIEEGFYRDDLNPDIIASLYIKRLDDVFFENEAYAKDFPQHEVFKQLFIYHLRGIVSSKGLKYLETKMNIDSI
jgi:AcrR family transcriptional regulator